MKICAMMRQTWYETAKAHLNDAERLMYYEACFNYEFTGVDPSGSLPVNVALLFDVSKDAIREDRDKAISRAERARQNGRLGGRPAFLESNQTQQDTTKPTRLQDNPVGNSGLAYTLHNNTTQHYTTKHDFLSTETESVIFWNVLLLFFSQGVQDPLAEVHLFWNYYSARAWKDKSGAEISDRLALAKTWRPKTCSALATKKRALWSQFLAVCPMVEDFLVTDFIDFKPSKDEKPCILTLSRKECAEWLENHVVGDLAAFLKVQLKHGISLEYRIINPELPV